MKILAHWGGDFGPGGGMMDGYGYGMGYGHGWFGSAIMIAFWVLIVVGLVYLIKWLAASSKHAGMTHTAHETPLDVLKKRYARGEIDKAEFEDRKKDIDG